jgi:hypothetical protein
MSAPVTGGGDRYRVMIDEGKLGDKIPGLDPALVPIDTDSEASGYPTPDELLAVEAAIQHDLAKRAGAPADGTHPHSALRAPPSPLPWLLVWSIILLGAIAIVIAALET